MTPQSPPPDPPPAAPPAAGPPPPADPPTSFDPNAKGPVPNIAPPGDDKPLSKDDAEKLKKDSEEKNEALQHPGPPGSATGRQAYDVTVPFAKTSLKLGVSAGQGGAGASLVTKGSGLVDSKGPADFQAAGSMAIQTDAALAAVSQGGTLVGTPATVEITAGAQIKLWGGSSVAPSACGGAGPAATPATPKSPPAAIADHIVAAATLPVSAGAVASGFSDMGSAPGAVGQGLGLVGGLAGAAGAAGGAVAAVGGPGGGGGTDVDIRGPAGVKMLTMDSIVGIAQSKITFQTVAKFSAMAAGKVEVQAGASVTLFALAKAELRGLVAAEVWSAALIGVNAPVINVSAKVELATSGAATDVRGAVFTANFPGSMKFETPQTDFVSNEVEIKHFLVVKNDVTCRANLDVEDVVKFMDTYSGTGKATVTGWVESKQLKLASMLEVGNALKVGS